jgi:hypothetical protein
MWMAPDSREVGHGISVPANTNLNAQGPKNQVSRTLRLNSVKFWGEIAITFLPATNG